MAGASPSSPKTPRPLLSEPGADEQLDLQEVHQLAAEFGGEFQEVQRELRALVERVEKLRAVGVVGVAGEIPARGPSPARALTASPLSKSVPQTVRGGG